MFPVNSFLSHPGRAVAAVLVAVSMPLGSLAPAFAVQDDEPLQVFASFSVLADIVQQVGGEHVEVTSLVPAGGDAHTFDPSPDQVRTMENADLIVQVGADYEPWLNNLMETAGSDIPRYAAFAGTADDDAGEHDHEHADDDHDHAEEGDDHADENHENHDDEHGAESHYWLDVQATIDTVMPLAETLAEIDPDNAKAYTANAEAYIDELEALDSWIEEQTAAVPEDQRLLVTVHRSMDAFADAYGYEITGVQLESHSTEGADAPAGHVAELVETIEEHDIPAVFPDTPGGNVLLEPVASEAGVEVAPQLYIDTLGADGEGPQSYIEMMRYNVDTIVTALGG